MRGAAMENDLERLGFWVVSYRFDLGAFDGLVFEVHYFEGGSETDCTYSLGWITRRLESGQPR